MALAETIKAYSLLLCIVQSVLRFHSFKLLITKQCVLLLAQRTLPSDELILLGVKFFGFRGNRKSAFGPLLITFVLWHISVALRAD